MSETKLHESFPVEQFCIDGYNTSFILDKSENSGGILVYLSNEIPCKEITSNLPEKCLWK